VPQDLHIQIEQTVRQNDPIKDKVVNSIYMHTEAAAVAGADYQGIADAVKKIFFGPNTGGTAPWNRFSGRAGRVLVYNMADPKPRPERAVSTYTPTTWAVVDTGPRQAALCLSFYSGRNLKSSRGRIYIGPLDVSDMATLPSSGLRQSVLDIGSRLFNIGAIGGLTWSHSIHSQKLANFQVVTNYWCNDVWDTVRKRLSKETTRNLYP
jgi:hypothetical protein